VRGRPTVFLDRDGVLTVEKGYICPVDEVEIFPYAEECIRRIHEKGYLAIVITNQSGVARGLFTEEQLLKVHEKIKKETGVDEIYYCPHHLEAKVRKYAIECRCRKPDIGLIEKADRDFGIDLAESYMVGDRAGDILTGKNAGIKTVLLESGYGSKNLEKDVKADFVLNDLRDLLGIL